MEKILFICIGNSKIIGDSLGPLVGSIILKNKNQIEKNTKIEVLGTITSPLVYSKIETAIEQINKNEYSKIIIIDSALGNKNNIGEVSINTSNINVGKSINKGRLITGDIIIKGIVAQNYHNVEKNKEALNKVTLEEIESISKKVLKIIYSIIPKKSIKTF